ncbi:ABC transporter permease [Zhihengliuella flava]|uniref:Oligopeptide transport system permease protein n=1 Tax=Zhihengliuella flava TaxID=1285193 RepID=A0A931D8A3_9MICC|nr:ABC transporter permease [Zhihengliuella flava]MBG6083848.1 oligopeptide transport system permease protein [Zhihengliuella flava]
MPENIENQSAASADISDVKHRGKQSKRHIEHFVAPLDETPLQGVDTVNTTSEPLSFWAESWRNLRKQPLFIISVIMILGIIVVSVFPQWFTSVGPRDCSLENARGGAEPGHPLGFTYQGCDIYARLIFGAQASVLVGLFTTIGVVIVGGTIGALAGYYGGWVDTVLARTGDIFFALPLILGAIVMMQLPAFRDNQSPWTVTLVLVIFGWPQVARITRGAVIEAKGADYVMAARALGVSKFGALIRHVLPNSLSPIIVVASISLGTYIVAEATLSYLGIGLPPSVVSWGNDISNAQISVRNDPQILFWPALALSITVLSFIMLGDALRDALDPKSRKA